MPTYEYHCDENGRSVEVSHSIGERLNTWAEVCERAGVESGDTADDAPVRRLIFAASFYTRGSAAAAARPAPPRANKPAKSSHVGCSCAHH